MFKNILRCFLVYSSLATGSELGAPCKVNGGPGKCVALNDCSSAKESFIKNGTKPPICSHGNDIIICCSHEPTATEIRTSENECDPITTLSAPEIGRKAWDKCLEYQERIVRPCRDAMLRAGKFRYNECPRDTTAIILGSEILEGEFPHMVLLGYPGIEENSTIWSCEGVIISERYVLTLAVCTKHRDLGNVRYIRTGVLRISEPVKQSNIYNVITIIRHPSFVPPKPQNDIALLETETDIVFDLMVMPACLDVGNLPSYERAVAAGWDPQYQQDDQLKKEFLVKPPNPSCRNDRYHYNESIQICYEKIGKNSRRYGNDMVLQVEYIKCMYVFIGLENKHSAQVTGIPYTRISAYIPWIESIVWP